MNALEQSEITFLSTETQERSISKSSWFSTKKFLIKSDREMEDLASFKYYKDHPVYIAKSSRAFQHFLSYFLENVINNTDLLAKFLKTSPVFIDLTGGIVEKYLEVLKTIFPIIITPKEKGFISLKEEELFTVLGKHIETRKIRAIAVNVLKDLNLLKIIKADFTTLIVPFESLNTTGSGLEPDFDDVEIIDFGNAIRFGDYESSIRALLYSSDKNYRLEQKKLRHKNEKSFGACLKRYRLEERVKQTDFKTVSERTIGRIEDGDKPTETTKNKILKELGITEKDLISY